MGNDESVLTSKQIRQQFLDFFQAKEHEIVPSSPVVPFDDPTLMFTNAGMNQFKDVFIGTGSRPFVRAADTQKCIRAGGKHNDLDDVGHDTYHHTFFEMLGNWSFGDYFKKEAIEWAWELLTEVWGIEADRLHATYFEGDKAEGLEPDLEAAELWRTVTSIKPENIHAGNKKDNFWEMGDTGPCGPCSEIHVDLTPDKSGGSLVNAGDARVIELWNLVFIQFNRDGDGKLTPLPAKHVDTGMGFERLCAILNGQNSNYDTDVFMPIFDAIQKRTAAPAYAGTLVDQSGESQGAKDASTEPRDVINDKKPSSEPHDVANDKNLSSEPHASACAASSDPGLVNPVDVNASERPRGLKPAAQEEMGSHDTCSRDACPHGDCLSAAGEDEVAKIGEDGRDQFMIDVSYRVIADHIRCLTFALTDGAMPSNEGRGYVLRRILRRAVRYGRQYLDMHEPFLCDLIEPLIEHMSEAFPELRTAHGSKNIEHLKDIVRDEEASFGRTLDRGIRLFDNAAKNARKHHQGCIRGEDAFKLHDTFGFPIDLTVLMAEEQGLTIDIREYEQLMEEARNIARTKKSGITPLFTSSLSWLTVNDKMQSFVGITDDAVKYTHDEIQASIKAIALFQSDDGCEDRKPELVLSFGGALHAGSNGGIILDRTCFYAEQGGQVGDQGVIESKNARFEVQNTIVLGGIVVHVGTVTAGEFHDHPKKENALLRLRVSSRRRNTSNNHTSTHILNWALREVLCLPDERANPHVQQKGSLVDPEKTRFDFSHNKPLSDDELTRIEKLCNEQIDAGLTVYTEEVDQAAARKIKTLRAVFGEKYPDTVRVVSIGVPIGKEGTDDKSTLLGNPDNPEWMKYSVEFCGGTHLKNTSEAKRFVLTAEEGVAKGIRRMVGVSGEAANQAIASGNELLEEATKLLELPSDQPLSDSLAALQQRLGDSVIPVLVRNQIREKLAQLQKIAKQQDKATASDAAGVVMERVAELLNNAKVLDGVAVIVGEVPEARVDALRGAIDWIRNKTDASAVLLISAGSDKVSMIAGMSKAVVAKGAKAGDLIKEIAPLVGGRGGGRPDMAQGGGDDPAGVAAAIEKAAEWIQGKLGD